MNELELQNLVPKKKKLKNDCAVFLAERDLLIIENILEMKFASIQNVFKKIC